MALIILAPSEDEPQVGIRIFKIQQRILSLPTTTSQVHLVQTAIIKLKQN